MKKYLILLMFAAWIAVGWADPVSDLLDGNVAFHAPKEWVSQASARKDNVCSIQWSIPDAASGPSSEGANAGLIVEKSGDSDILDRMEEKLKADEPSFERITKIEDGDPWRTYLATGRQNRDSYVILDRIGAADGFAVFFRLSFPIHPGRDPGWNTKIVSQANDFMKSLKIRGKTDLHSQFQYVAARGKEPPTWMFRLLDDRERDSEPAGIVDR